MSARFTPGPWSVRRSLAPVDGAYDFAISADGSPVLAEAFGRTSDGGYPPAEANARLIAAAPDMYEALKAVASLKGWDEREPVAATGRQVMAAIAKAEGPQ